MEKNLKSYQNLSTVFQKKVKTNCKKLTVSVLLRISPYSVRMRENADQKKIHSDVRER